MALAKTSDEHPLEGPAFEPFRARLRRDADLSKTNWFRVGGLAQYLFKPENTEDLSAFLRALPAEIPLTILGVGSNVIIRDGGIEGVVVKLGRGFTAIETIEANKMVVGAACMDVHLAQFACEHSLAGLEFLSGVPGTIGGAVRMNAGAYGSDMSQVLVEAEVVLRDGTVQICSAFEMKFSYRNSALPEGAVITKAILQAKPGDKAAIEARMAEIAKAREDTQPIRTRTGGSTFKNPPGYKAWELIDKAGCRGLRQGGAQVSEQHCNFLINNGSATAREIEDLGEAIRRRVRDMTGIALEWEIKRIGKP